MLLTDKKIKMLEQIAREVRIDILKMLTKAGSGHTGGSLSIVEILVAIYFHVSDITPDNWRDPRRDRFVLSKGHATPALYAVLARLGFFWGLSDQSGISISVEPGDDEILAGADLEIRARVGGFARKAPELHVISDGEETAFTMERHDSLRAKGQARFTSTLARVDRDIGYFVTVGDEATRTYRISVYEEPRIKSGRIALSYPTYTGLGKETLPQGVWDITAPYGTEALLEFEAYCAPESVWVSVTDSTGRADEWPVIIRGDTLSLHKVLHENFAGAGAKERDLAGEHLVK